MNTDDLDRATLRALLVDRPFRTFPAMLSTDAEALSWARQGAPHGAVVVAGYQASPRGRTGRSWDDHMDGASLGCSVVVRPDDLPVDREGWLYLPALLALHDTLSATTPAGDLRVEWPDELHHDGAVVGAVGVQPEPDRGRVRWAVVTLLVFRPEAPRGTVLERLVAALDTRLAQDPTALVDDYRDVCTTMGRRVRALILPMGSASPSFTGEAVDVTDDGGVVIATDEGQRMVVVPQSLGFLEDPASGPMGPAGIG